jgi:RecB family endonuclease NucS
MASNGGARPGAGRKRKYDKYQSAIEKAELRIAQKLPDILDNLEVLADGGQQVITEKYQPAGLVTLTKQDEEGNSYQVPAFPDLDPLEQVLVEKTVVTAGRDRAANQYLADRVMGRPTQHQEISGRIESIKIEYADPDPIPD